MTWTYGPTFSLARDRIRLLIGDTDSSDQLVSDEEIAVYVTGGQLAQSSDYLSAAMVCDAIAAKMSRRADMSAGGSSVSLSQQATAYQTKARHLRRQAALSTSPFIGGQSISDKDSREEDTDRVTPAFTREMGDETASDWQATA